MLCIPLYALSIKNQKGVALILTILILSSVLVVSLGIATILNRSLKISRISSETNVAYLAAESGAERALWLGRKTDFNELSLISSSCADASCVAPTCRCCNGVVDLDNKVCDETVPYYEHAIGSNSSFIVTYQLNDPDGSVSGSPSSVSGDEINIFTIIGKYLDVKRSIEVQYRHAE